jgi:hypothetical protein
VPIMTRNEMFAQLRREARMVEIASAERKARILKEWQRLIDDGRDIFEVATV